MALFNVKKREFAHLHPPPTLLLPSASSLGQLSVGALHIQAGFLSSSVSFWW